MTVVPVLVLAAAPERVREPVPFLMKPPVVVPTAPERVVSPAPPTVSVRVAPVMPPERVSRPLSLWRVELLPRVTAPVQVLLPEMLRRAPSVAMPVPLSVSGSPLIVMPPCS